MTSIYALDGNTEHVPFRKYPYKTKRCLLLPHFEKLSVLFSFLPFCKNPANIYFFNNRNTRNRWEICSKSTKKTSEWSQWRRSGVFIVSFEQFHFLSRVSFVDFEQEMLAGKLLKSNQVEILGAQLWKLGKCYFLNGHFFYLFSEESSEHNSFYNYTVTLFHNVRLKALSSFNYWSSF